MLSMNCIRAKAESFRLRVKFFVGFSENKDIQEQTESIEEISVSLTLILDNGAKDMLLFDLLSLIIVFMYMIAKLFYQNN